MTDGDQDRNGRTGAVVIVPYGDISTSQRLRADAVIEQIFFEASSVQRFENATVREAFRWLWLGRYLAEEPEHAFVAMCDGVPCGYLVGSLDDPALRQEFSALTYFQDFAAQTALFPAHLHLNVDAGRRGAGVGQRLVAAFERHAAERGASGVHLVTGVGMRNVAFYERLGFVEVGRAPRNGAHVVMLGKRLEMSGRGM